MAREVRLRAGIVDTQALRPGARRLTYFGERTGESPSITAPNEAEIAKLILGTPQFSVLVLEELGLSLSARYALNVRSPFTSTGQKPGDVDVLLADSTHPHFAVALECKRVKVRTDTAGGQRINRLDQFENGYIQANALGGLGFARTFLTALVVVDGRFDPNADYVSRGTTPGTFQALFDTAMDLPLDPDVGLLYVELAQPVNALIAHSATIAVAILKPATPREQRGYRTTQISNYLADQGQDCGQDVPGLHYISDTRR